MPRKTKRQPQHPPKSVLSEESQLLLEEIFAFFRNREEAKKDPDLCLEAMLTKIYEDLVLGNHITAMLYSTLDGACYPGVPVFVRQRKKTGEHGHFEMRKGRRGKAQTV